jgi:hypothetical protein
MTQSELISEQESWRIAKLLIEMHGRGALRHARDEAERSLFSDDIMGGAAWMRVARAVDTLLENEWNGTIH